MAEVRFSTTRNRPYFYSRATSQSLWEPPAGMTHEAVLALPGADYLSHTAPTAPAVPASSSNKARASHLLIKHVQSRRASSWKEANITRTRDEAMAILRAHQRHLKNSPDLAAAFAELAKLESDCSSAREGGDLGQSQTLHLR